MEKDLAIFSIGGNNFSIEVDSIKGVIEGEKIFFLPSCTSFVKGLVTYRSKPVCVIDALKIFGVFVPDTFPNKIIVTEKDGHTLGLYIGDIPLTFAWKKDIEILKKTKTENKYILNSYHKGGMPLQNLDLDALYEETVSILSAN